MYGRVCLLLPAMLVTVAVSASAGCGGDASCDSAGAAMCERACACTDGPGCQIQDGTLVLSFDSKADCRGFYSTLVCPESDQLDPQPDWGACESAAAEAACVTVEDGSSAARSPSECGSDEAPAVDAAPMVDAAVDATPPDAFAGEAAIIEQGDYNWTLLEGAPLPGRANDPAEVRKAIAVTEIDPEDRFELGTAYLVQDSPTLDATHVIISVTNTGAEPRCFVEARLTEKRNDGSAVGTEIGYVSGSLSNVTSVGTYTNTCLLPSEKGYLTYYLLKRFTTIEQLDVALSSSTYDSAPDITVLPYDYSFEFNSLLVIRVDNRSSAAADLVTATWVLLGDDGLPVDTGLIDRFDEPQRIAGGTKDVVTSSEQEGLVAPGQRLWVSLQYTPSTTAAASTSPEPPWLAEARAPQPGEAERWYQAQRTERTRALERQLSR